jgi:hypothetical protein
MKVGNKQNIQKAEYAIAYRIRCRNNRMQSNSNYLAIPKTVSSITMLLDTDLFQVLKAK